mgnify:FL=1
MQLLIAGALAACAALALLVDGDDENRSSAGWQVAEIGGPVDDPGVAPPAPQERAGELKPKPSKATKDKSRMFSEGCQADAPEVRLRRCIYGDRDGKRTVALIGDSHALMYFTAMNRLAKERGWRLVALSKVGCPPFRQLVYNRRVGRGYRECLVWQRRVLNRLERERPGLVVTSGWIWHKAMVRGRIVPRTTPRNRRLLRDGYVRLLRDLRRRTGARLAVMKDPPKAPYEIPPCVEENLASLSDCAFEIPASHDRQSFERSVIKRVPGATLVDLTPVFCPERLCHAVIRNRITYRDGNHLTSTYARHLSKQLGERLPRPRPRR